MSIGSILCCDIDSFWSTMPKYWQLNESGKLFSEFTTSPQYVFLSGGQSLYKMSILVHFAVIIDSKLGFHVKVLVAL